MPVLIVTDNPARWPLEVEGTSVVSARDYLTRPEYQTLARARILNMCRTYKVQSLGYYVSLLAEARGHRPTPSVAVQQNLRHAGLLRLADEELRKTLANALAKRTENEVELRLYFGEPVDGALSRLGKAIFGLFPAPFLCVNFVRAETWRLDGIRVLDVGQIPDDERDFAIERTARYLARNHVHRPSRSARFDVAMLVDRSERDSPSDDAALAKFVRAGAKLGLEVSEIERDDFGSLSEYDGLFIRATTYVDHFTFRFATQAEAQGIVVIDDPTSILRATNKVFMAEAFARENVSAPRTVIAHKGNTDEIADVLGFPCVLKRPDSSFSQGVVRANDPVELREKLDALLEKSALVVAQEFTPSEFDWRVGVLGGRALYACRYHMAPNHWQIQKSYGSGARRYGKVDTMAVADAPPAVIDLGVRAAAVIGAGLYGVDIKDLGERLVVMEVNDNPSIEAGVEDAVLGDELYLAVMDHFRAAMEARGRENER